MPLTKRIGLIVNPIAGMGGSVGLKGTDNAGTAARAAELGAVPRAGDRAAATLAILRERLGADLQIIAAAGSMGETAARVAGWTPEVVGEPKAITSAADTQEMARLLQAERIDLLVFAGGDGTARDLHAVAAADLPVLGIPSGVKMHSAVYATTPRAAAETIVRFLTGAVARCRDAEVMDIDEDAFRQGRVSARLYGSLRTPDVPQFVQRLKAGSGGTETGALSGIADEVIERMRDGALWIVGPGSTTKAIIERMGGDKTLLGVDLFYREERVAADVTASDIAHHLDSGQPARIVVTPIGGQGFLIGRGNQQLSPDVIRRVERPNIVVVASMDKIAGLRGEPFLVDTGDPTLDDELRGYIRVVTGYRAEVVHRVA